jgi:hypothetical protein
VSEAPDAPYEEVRRPTSMRRIEFTTELLIVVAEFVKVSEASECQAGTVSDF